METLFLESKKIIHIWYKPRHRFWAFQTPVQLNIHASKQKKNSTIKHVDVTQKNIYDQIRFREDKKRAAMSAETQRLMQGHQMMRMKSKTITKCAICFSWQGSEWLQHIFHFRICWLGRIRHKMWWEKIFCHICASQHIRKHTLSVKLSTKKHTRCIFFLRPA